MAVKIEVCYFSILREEANRDKESLETSDATPEALYERLAKTYQFSLPLNSLRVAINNEFMPWSTPLKDKDVVVFIPPVSGG
jgi:molybdopterin converting factor subunit 1